MDAEENPLGTMTVVGSLTNTSVGRQPPRTSESELLERSFKMQKRSIHCPTQREGKRGERKRER